MSETSTANEPSPKKVGIRHYIGIALSWGVLALVAAVGAAVVAVPAVSGATPLTVLTNSMSPTYAPGTLVVVKPVATSDIRVGDAITYQISSDDPAVITHRVQAVTFVSDGSRNFITKGDHNPSADPTPVIPDQVKGRVWYSIPYVGWVSNAMNGPARGAIMPIIGGALFLYIGYNIAAGATKLRRKKQSREA